MKGTKRHRAIDTQPHTISAISLGMWLWVMALCLLSSLCTFGQWAAWMIGQKSTERGLQSGITKPNWVVQRSEQGNMGRARESEAKRAYILPTQASEDNWAGSIQPSGDWGLGEKERWRVRMNDKQSVGEKTREKERQRGPYRKINNHKISRKCQ